MEYEGATICINGHIISCRIANIQDYCSQCGQKAFSVCPECKEPVHGLEKFEGVVNLNRSYNKPYYCHKCGKPYPWTQHIIDNAVELLSIDGDVDEEIKRTIKEAIPNLLVETPMTQYHAIKFKNCMDKVSNAVSDLMKQLLKDAVIAGVKGLIFG